MSIPEKSSSHRLFDDSMPAIQGQLLPSRSELLPTSQRYPKRLLELRDAPQKLYALGDVELLNRPALAIVGARKATTYGLECAERFARKAAQWGVLVVSGGAIGCDMAAHRGALDAGAKTVVVLGSGADVVYPLRARGLFKEILRTGGTLLSEAPWGSPPLAWAFSKRNRIIAALAAATLIVEAGLPSGTFQTADHTLSLGNEVLVVPGPIFSATCKGTNRLLLQGAVPIVDDESFEDTLLSIFGPAQTRSYLSAGALEQTQQEGKTGDLRTQEISPPLGESGRNSAQKHSLPQVERGLSPEEIRLRQLTAHILTDLNASPMTIDALAQAHRRDVVEVVRVVTTLEIQGALERLRDGRYIAKPGKQL
ncbi:MAG: DNA-processing protein DprA [Coriobacteriales bacterium]|jgi:DNA processing protein|nr:DNA-processing protein DprA [Coriobacteriales bacterium]